MSSCLASSCIPCLIAQPLHRGYSTKFYGLKQSFSYNFRFYNSVCFRDSRKGSKKLEICGKDQAREHADVPLPGDVSIPEAVNDTSLQNASTKETSQIAAQNTQDSLSSEAVKELNASGNRWSSVPEVSYNFDQTAGMASSLCIAVVGATGELARNKVFPALFALYYSGFLPKNVGIFGYSRKPVTNEDLRAMIAETLTCRVDHDINCGDKLDSFLGKTYHINARYNNKEGMAKLDTLMKQIKATGEANRIFYLSVPQEALLDVASSIADHAQSKHGWNRIIIEKPFGLDALSSHQMNQYLLSKFEEKQIYRIDHLLGKDLIENLTVLRFSNLVFEPLWSRTYIRNVQVILSEDCGIERRGRYSDGYGIIQDIVHSHILQTVALFAMEPPVTLDGEDIRNEKVKVLRSIRKLEFGDVVLGQHKYISSGKTAAYSDSLTPTFFAAALYIDNARWDGVPFLIKTGMGLIKHRKCYGCLIKVISEALDSNHHSSHIRMDWLKSYSQRRYGRSVAQLDAAWQILYHTIYNCTDGIEDHNKDFIVRFPDLDPSGAFTSALEYTFHGEVIPRLSFREMSSSMPKPHLWYSTEEAIDALKLFISVGHNLKGSRTFRYDLVDLTRQVLAKLSNHVFLGAITAYQNRDINALTFYSSKFMELIKDLDDLLASDDNFLLGTWLESSKGLAMTYSEKLQYEWNARTQVTMWYDNTSTNQSKLHDYANKYWSGLLKGYYLPRTSTYFSYMLKSLRQNESLALEEWRKEWISYSNKWQSGHELYPTNAKGDALVIAKKMVQKYLSG